MSSPVDILADLASRLRQLREDRNLTQVEVAALLGVSERTYQAWESGEVFPQAKHRRALASFLAEEVAA